MGIRKLKQKVAVALAGAMSVMNVLTPLAAVGTPSASTKSITVTFNAGDGGSFDLDKVASGSNASKTNTSKDSSTDKKLVRVFTDLRKQDKTNYPYTSLEIGGAEKGEDYSVDGGIITGSDKDAEFYGWYCDGTLVEDTTDIFSDVTLEARWYEVSGTMTEEEKEALAVEADLPAGNTLILNTLEEKEVTEALAKEETKKALDAELEKANVIIPADSPMYTMDIKVEGSAKTAEITMNVPEAFAEVEKDRLRVVHFADDYSSVKEFLTPIIKDDRMTFTMTGFSPVAIVVTEEKASGDAKVTVKNVENGYIAAWTEAKNPDTNKKEKTYLPLDEAVALEAGTELYLQPYGYGNYYSDGWTGKLESLKEVKDGKETDIPFDENVYSTSISYNQIVYTVKENCEIQADFTRWVPEVEEGSGNNNQKHPEFSVSVRPSSSESSRYSGRISVKQWDDKAKTYKEISGYKVRIATEKELNDALGEDSAERYKDVISKFTYENDVLYSKDTLKVGSYEIPIVILYKDKEYLLEVNEESQKRPYRVWVYRNEGDAYLGLYNALVYDNGKLNTSIGMHLYNTQIQSVQKMIWKDVCALLVGGLEKQEYSYGLPKMYHYPVLSWQDENGKELKDNDIIKGNSNYFYTLFKKADGTAYHVEAKYEDGPLTDKEYTVLVKNVDNGYLQAFTGNWDDQTYIPLDEKITLPAGTKINLYAMGYKMTENEKDWEGKLTSLKLISGKEEKDIIDGDNSNYTIKLDKDYSIEATFTKTLESEKERSKFYFYAEPKDTTGKYSSSVNVSVLSEDGSNKYQKLDPSAYTLRIANEDDFFKAGISSSDYDKDLFTYENGTLSSKEELELDLYNVPLVVTYQGQDWFYDALYEDAYSVLVSVGVSTSFYHGAVTFGGQYQQDNGSDYIDQVRFEKDGKENWSTAEALFDTTKTPKMYGYKFAGWQNYKGEEYKADSPLVSEYENVRYFSAFDKFVKADDETKPYETPKATIDGKEPVLPDNPEDPDNPNNPSNPNGNGSGSSGGGSRRHVVGGSSTRNSYTMTGNWVVGENGWRFHKSTGEYAANTWGWINGQYYYFDANGNMVTGWQFINGQWYYLNPAEGSLQGAMVVGVIYDPVYNAYFYANPSGAMVTGWNQVNQKWYYFSPVNDGVHVTGALLSGTYVDGYYLGADGAWVSGN